MTNRFNKHDLVENQANVTFFDMLERSLTTQYLNDSNQAYMAEIF